MISFPNAKINLGLNILNKRSDGFHDIESCFYPIPWYDSLEILESDQFSFNSYGLEIAGEQDSNLCIQAYNLIQADFDIPPVAIHLIKSMPMGAGLGGGSSDGAFTLNILNELFELKIDIKKLKEYALELGSDCPFFIENKPAIATGRGEHLKIIDLDLKGYHLALHNPGIHISTQEAYSGVVPSHPSNSIESILHQSISDWKDKLFNDFEASIFRNHPGVKLVKDEMYEAGALYSSMTGSGSTVYGIFDKLPPENNWKVFPFQ
jgi:4-diphosphocytidyl-2-C-methyl-D-erythritol kinase